MNSLLYVGAEFLPLALREESSELVCPTPLNGNLESFGCCEVRF